MVIFGPPDAQQKAKALIEDIVTDGVSPFHLGTSPQKSFTVLIAISWYQCLRQHVSLCCFFSASDRKVYHRGEYMSGGKQDSVWSSEQLQAASVVAPRTPIDWSAIRQNKQKYEELKWKGQSFCCVRLLSCWKKIDQP